jgi:hypothetical protein
VVVALLLLLLLLLWSRKELNLGNCKCCTDDEEDIAASQKPLAIALSRSSQSKSISGVVVKISGYLVECQPLIVANLKAPISTNSRKVN